VTRRFERFWQALEQVPDLAAVPVEWRALLGGDFAAAGRFLLPTPRIAGSVRSTAPGRTCVHEVRRWKGRFLSVCPDGCESAELTRDEVTVHRLDVPQPKADDGMVFFPTPAGARWSDVSIRFIDRHSVYVTVKGVSGTYHCTQMGMANRKNAKPTVQWLLLETFAEGHGLLDWRNRKADRKNQKRKENLAADLQRLFRIEGDPFTLEGDGWRARFAVAVRE